MLISLLILVLSCPDMVMVYAFYAFLQGVLVNVIVNQNNTLSYICPYLNAIVEGKDTSSVRVKNPLTYTLLKRFLYAMIFSFSRIK